MNLFRLSSSSESLSSEQISEKYRAILRSEFAKRSSINPRFTLRAFALKIGVTPSRLHDILSGRNGLSKSLAEHISENLKLTKELRDDFCDLVESAHGRSVTQKTIALSRLMARSRKAEFKKLSADVFKALSDWSHFAIMEVTALENFKFDVKTIASQLDIEPSRVRAAISRLLRLGLLKKYDERLMAVDARNDVGEQVRSEAIQKYHADILELAKTALRNRPVAEREYSSLIFAVNKNEMPQAKHMIQKFNEDFSNRFEASSKKDAVYNLSIQLFEITNGKSE